MPGQVDLSKLPFSQLPRYFESINQVFPPLFFFLLLMRQRAPCLEKRLIDCAFLGVKRPWSLQARPWSHRLVNICLAFLPIISVFFLLFLELRHDMAKLLEIICVHCVSQIILFKLSENIGARSSKVRFRFISFHSILTSLGATIVVLAIGTTVGCLFGGLGFLMMYFLYFGRFLFHHRIDGFDFILL